MRLLTYMDFAYKVLLANAGKLRHPYKIFLVVTKSCGSRCTNCHIWKEVPKNELTLAEYDQMSKKLGKSLSWLNISGGEPTDREDLVEIFRIFIKNCPYLLIVNFTSNGLNPERLESVAAFLNTTTVPFIGVNISVDGPEEIHQKLRGGSDSYKKALQSLEMLRKYKKLKVHASMTLFEKNAHLIDATYAGIVGHIPDFKKSSFHLNYPFQSEHYYQNSKVGISTEIKPPDYLISWRDFFKPIELIKIIYQKKLKLYYMTKKNPIACSAMTSNVYVSEHGELYTCTIWNEKVGSLRENGFDLGLVMKNKRALELKKKISENDCPNCWSPCEAFPSILDNLKNIAK